MSSKRTNPAVACRLQHLGVPMEYDERETTPAVRIWQSGAITENSAFLLPGGATGVILHIGITSDLPNFAISRFELVLPWSDRYFRWLTDPAEDTTARVSGYCFPGTDIYFDHEIVLNQRATECAILPRGHSIKGLLLGLGYQTIPIEFRHGCTVPALVTVVDQYEQRYSQEVNFWIERGVEHRAKNAFKSRRGPLFESRDPIPASARED